MLQFKLLVVLVLVMSYSINIHKVDDANQPLKGAKFKVVRQANNQVIGEYVNQMKMVILLSMDLLKDKYILTEIASTFRSYHQRLPIPQLMLKTLVELIIQ